MKLTVYESVGLEAVETWTFNATLSDEELSFELVEYAKEDTGTRKVTTWTPRSEQKAPDVPLTVQRRLRSELEARIVWAFPICVREQLVLHPAKGA